MSTISKEIFDHLVDLASLELSDDEAVYLHKELNQQLKAIHELEAIPLNDEVKITSHGIPYTLEESLILRDDVVVNYSSLDDLIEQFPQFEDGYVIVPDIEHITLE
jgi:aspartyl/glutamyl-tRNA(Asn/Gln) amidotransferase C subunit